MLPYPSKMVTTLINMPVELLHEVINEVKRPADLYSLCLVSKMILAVGVIHLYRELVYSPMTPEAAERVCITLANSDGLLPLVNTFRLGVCLRHCSVRLEAAFLRLLSSFPDHSICSFILDGHFLRPSHQDFLWSHQRRIYDLQFTLITDEISQLPGSGYSRRSGHAQQLETPGSDNTMGPTSSSLRVHGMRGSKFWESSIISQRTLPIENLKHLALENVFIQGLSLDSLPYLTHLAFRNCPASSICLKRYTSPKLKALYFYYDPIEWNILANVNTFLSSFRGLETLAVRDIWRYEATREERRGMARLANAIELHKDSLSFLLVHFNHMVHNNPHYYVPILRAAVNCINLRQLGLSLSPKRLERTCLGLIANLPRLVTLRIDLQHCLRYFTLWHQNPFTGISGYARIFGGVAASLMATAATGPGQSNFSLLSIGYRVASISHLTGPIECHIDRCPENTGSCDCSHGFEISDAHIFRRMGTLAHRITAVEAKDRIREADIIDFRYRFFNCG